MHGKLPEVGLHPVPLEVATRADGAASSARTEASSMRRDD